MNPIPPTFQPIMEGRAVAVKVMLPLQVIDYFNRQPWRPLLDEQIETSIGVASFALHCADPKLRALGESAALENWEKLRHHSYFRGCRLEPFTLRFRPGSPEKWQAVASAAGITVERLLRGAAGKRYADGLSFDLWRKMAANSTPGTQAA